MVVFISSKMIFSNLKYEHTFKHKELYNKNGQNTYHVLHISPVLCIIRRNTQSYN